MNCVTAASTSAGVRRRRDPRRRRPRAAGAGRGRDLRAGKFVEGHQCLVGSGVGQQGELGGPVRVPGQAVLRPLRHPGVAGRRGRHGRRGGRPGRRGRLPGRRQGPGAGRRPRQGRRHQAGQRRRRGPRCTPANILGMDIKGHVVKRVWVEHASDIAEEYYASFTLDRARQEAPADAVGARAASRSRRSPRRTPTPSSCCHIDPVDGLSLPRRARRASTRKLNADGDRRRRRHPREAVPLLHRGRLRPGRDQPADPTPDGGVHALDAKVSLDDNAAFRHPEWDEYRATEELDEREQLAREQGPAVHRPRRHGRHHRQRRRPGDEHARRRQPGRRHAPPTSSTSAAAPTPT